VARTGEPGWAAPALIAIAALLGLALLVAVSPDYVGTRGFPLDDAWIHAVYGRSLATRGALEYNPGERASGETSPLWAVVVAVPHFIARSPTVVVVAIKLVGFLLHVLTALLLWRALYAGGRRDRWPCAIAALLVAIDPDLVAASVSGMEVPLATLAACVLLLTAERATGRPHAAATALALLTRPELGVLAWGLPLLVHLRNRVRLRGALAGALVGTVVAGVITVGINWAGSGRPLPATFYAKVGAGRLPLLVAQRIGFASLVGRWSPFESALIIVALAVVALVRLRGAVVEAAPAAAYLGGLLFCALSFALISPIDPEAFYHQRYPLPSLPLLLAFVPFVLEGLTSRIGRPRLSLAVAASLVAAVMLAEAPARHRHLVNDARNIDDVQVQLGRSLADAAPTDVVWMIDAGAARYFGRAFVVDMMGLNTPQMLGPDAASFLERHPPRMLDLFGGWSSVDKPDGLSTRTFATSTRYTVTRFSAMSAHTLALCPSGATLVYQVRSRRWPVRCQAR